MNSDTLPILRAVLASANQNKHAEFENFFKNGTFKEIGIQLESCDCESRPLPAVDETGESYEENALIKAQAWADAFGMPAIADDSGLEVRGLGWGPGIFSARVAEGNDEERISWLLSKLDGVCEADRRACFVACIVIAFPSDIRRRNGPERSYFAAQGRCWGFVTKEPSGKAGFGYDPIFTPDGCDKTFAELGSEIKSKISHRARAMFGVAQMAPSVLKYWSVCKREFAR
jgi:XTP/dITP diphosphohydrolase